MTAVGLAVMIVDTCCLFFMFLDIAVTVIYFLNVFKPSSVYNGQLPTIAVSISMADTIIAATASGPTTVPCRKARNNMPPSMIRTIRSSFPIFISIDFFCEVLMDSRII